jgi:cell division septal protein FtsQ
MAALFALAALPQSSLFLIERIDVDGGTTLDAAAVRSMAGLHLGQRLFTVNADAVAARLRAHPRVKTADVRIRPLNAVVITFTERRPLVALTAGDRFALIDEDLMVVDVSASPGSLVQVVDRTGRSGWARPGTPAPPDALRAAFAAIAAVPEALRPLVVRIIVAPGPDLTFVTRTGLEVRAGGLPGLSGRLAQVPALLAALRARQMSVASIDLRYAGSIVVRPLAGGEAR